jgi:hypothetical protein
LEWTQGGLFGFDPGSKYWGSSVEGCGKYMRFEKDLCDTAFGSYALDGRNPFDQKKIPAWLQENTSQESLQWSIPLKQHLFKKIGIKYFECALALKAHGDG